MVEAVLEDCSLSKVPKINEESVICREIGSGKNKKEAEQDAACRIIKNLGLEEELK